MDLKDDHKWFRPTDASDRWQCARCGWRSTVPSHESLARARQLVRHEEDEHPEDT